MTFLKSRHLIIVDMTSTCLVKETLPRVFDLLQRVGCRVKDDTYLQCFATQLATFFHGVEAKSERGSLAEDTGLLRFLRRSLVDDNAACRDFAYLLMEKLCLEVEAVALAFRPERDLDKPATTSALAFLNR